MTQNQMSLTAETMAQLQAALGKAYDGKTNQPLNKAVTTGTGLVFYDLQAPAKNLYPVITPLRNAVPRVSGKGGTATNWKQITSISGSGWNGMGYVPEGQRSAAMSYQAVDKAASYINLGEEDYLTFQAEAAAEGFEDENAMVTFRLLQKMMMKEEVAILGGNRTLSLTTPTTPTLSASGSGATLGTATYSVIVVALTLEGTVNSNLTDGVATSKLITGMDGQTFTLNGGSSNKSAAGSQAITLGQTLFCSTPVVNGAVAYAWYVGLAGAEKLERISYINSAAFSAPLTGTGQAATAVTANCSLNASYAMDGLMTTAFLPGNLAYVKSLATGTAGTGTTLTASGRGTVTEIDDMLQSMWDNYRISPTVIYVSSQEIKNITTKCLSTASAPLLRYNANAQGAGQPYTLTAGGTIDFYFNPFNHQGGSKIPIRIHPNLPAGTIICYAEQLPEWYQSNEVPNVAEIRTQRDYYRMDWPLRTTRREYGVYALETMAIYAPFAMGIITNIANG